MIDCPECGAAQVEGTLFCGECGGSLVKKEKLTNVLPFSEFTYRTPPAPLDNHVLITPQKPHQITFVIPSSRRRLTLSLDDTILVGRLDDQAEDQPALDLTQDQGAERGVSRRHAIFEASSQGIALIDLGSTNGTILNNFKLPADEPYLVKDGDEIRFGDLLVHVLLD